jgi:uncharacterized lipoprotein YddW (UPF0748 family)
MSTFTLSPLGEENTAYPIPRVVVSGDANALPTPQALAQLTAKLAPSDVPAPVWALVISASAFETHWQNQPARSWLRTQGWVLLTERDYAEAGDTPKANDPATLTLKRLALPVPPPPEPTPPPYGMDVLTPSLTLEVAPPPPPEPPMLKVWVSVLAGKALVVVDDTTPLPLDTPTEALTPWQRLQTLPNGSQLVANVLAQAQQLAEVQRQQAVKRQLTELSALADTFWQNLEVSQQLELRLQSMGMKPATSALKSPTYQATKLAQQADALKQQLQVALQQPLATTPEATQAAFKQAQALYHEALTHVIPPLPQKHGRGIWLDRGTLVKAGSAEGLTALLRQYKALGLQDVFIETVNAGFPIYPQSEVLPMQNPLLAGWDPLAVAVAEGHQLGLRIHAWVWCFAVGNKRHNPLINLPTSYAGPVLSLPALQGEALAFTPAPNDGQRYHQDEFWLSPASPKAQAYLLAMMQEITDRYAVDGLHLDYIRWPFQKSNWRAGVDPTSLQRFYDENPLPPPPNPPELLPDAPKATVDAALKAYDAALTKYMQRVTQQSERIAQGLPPLQTLTWQQWKVEQVNAFVATVSQTLKQRHPNLILSTAVFALPRDNRLAAIQQDWETWVRKGWIDWLVPMTYTPDPAALRAEVTAMYRQLEGTGVQLYPGIGLHKLEHDQLLASLAVVQQAGSSGHVLFAASQLVPSVQAVLQQGPYQPWPTMAWRQENTTDGLTRFRRELLWLNALIGTEVSPALQALLADPVASQVKAAWPEQAVALRRSIWAKYGHQPFWANYVLGELNRLNLAVSRL